MIVFLRRNILLLTSESKAFVTDNLIRVFAVERTFPANIQKITILTFICVFVLFAVKKTISKSIK